MNTRSDTDAVNFRACSDSVQWPKLLGTAAASSLATLFVVRNFFPAEKKVHHSIRADDNVGDDAFVRTMGHLLGPPLLEGNKVTLLENGDQIFPAMLDGIRSARRTITFENFLFREGEVSDAFGEALADRARNGAKVHFLQDALGCDAVQGRAIKLMKRAGCRSGDFSLRPFFAHQLPDGSKNSGCRRNTRIQSIERNGTSLASRADCFRSFSAHG